MFFLSFCSLLEKKTSLDVPILHHGGSYKTYSPQATMPSPPATYRPYMRGVYVAYAVLTWCYAGVGITGYHAFGEPSLLFHVHRL